MVKRDLTKIFIDEIYSKLPKKNYSTNEITYTHIDEIWSVDLADFSDYKTSNNKGCRCIFIIKDKYSKHLWAIPLKNKYSQTITNEFSNILSKSQRKPLKLEWDRGSEFYKSIFKNLLNSENYLHYSRFTDKGPSIAERIIRTVRNFLKKPIFLAGEASWINELSPVIKKYNNTIHHSTKMTPVQASKNQMINKTIQISKTRE